MRTGSQTALQIRERTQGRGDCHGNPARLEQWHGASGSQYQHLVYDLIDCPLAPKANYVLAYRGADGRTTVLKVGRTSHDAPTLNRAQLRHEAALLGANEVHVHVMARTEAERILIEFDIGAAPQVSGEAVVSATRH